MGHTQHMHLLSTNQVAGNTTNTYKGTFKGTSGALAESVHFVAKGNILSQSGITD